MTNNIKNNGFWKYVMSGIILILVFASFTYSTVIYRDLSLKLDNHLLNIETKFDRKMDKLYDKVDEVKDKISEMSERITKLER